MGTKWLKVRRCTYSGRHLGSLSTRNSTLRFIRPHLPSKWKLSKLVSSTKLSILFHSPSRESIPRLLHLLSRDMLGRLLLLMGPNIERERNRLRLPPGWLSIGFNGKDKALGCHRLASRLKRKRQHPQNRPRMILTTSSSTTSKIHGCITKPAETKSMEI